LVEVVIVGNLPVQAQPLLVQHLDLQLVGLLHGKEFDFSRAGAKSTAIGNRQALGLSQGSEQ
jgi:hypothetical protein